MIGPQSAVWALVLLVILVTLASLRPLLPIDETRYLDVAWEMRLSGDVFHLTRNFELYTQKPPLLFWLINLVWQFAGVSEFAARLVAPAFGVASAIAMAGLARRLWPEDEGVGARSILVLTGFTVFLIYASLTLFDTMLTFATILGVGLLWRIGQGERGRWLWIAFGLVLALGVYAKGPVIFVHLMPVLLTMPFWAPSPPRLVEAGKGFGIALGAGLFLVAVWLVPALIGGTAAYREELLWTQSAARVAGGLAHDRPVWFLASLLPVLLFPWAWSWRLWPAVVRAVRGDAGGRMLAIWAGSGLVLFSLISGKQIHYLIPEFPAVAMLMARALGSVERTGRGGSAAAAIPVVIGLAALALALGLISTTGDLEPLKPGWVVALFGLVCIALGVFGWRLTFTRAHAVFGIGIAAALHILIETTGFHTADDHHEISAKLAAAENGGLAVAEMIYNAEFNFGARLTTPVAVLSGPDALRSWSAAYPEGLLFGPVDRVPLTSEPESETFYNGTRYGFWSAATVAASIRG
ncbi:ArnT family glycosyltransferase [Defluviimonas sp. D31]|uniref:ArnT family glycosyltransferase n=1 Tax=Defluviimonas sp. D31 TaxID=3083253 RepID=UPI00296FF74E|nr:phospholipid carrier-dependent glycosyltransferase [Defluviimonas sp. D31]